MSEIMEDIEWATSTISNRLEFGLGDSKEAGYARERRAKGVLLSCKDKIQKLEKALEVARECNRFYADKDNWETYLGGESDYAMIIDDQEKLEKVVNFYGSWQSKDVGGKLARQAEKQIKEILGEK